ncbi:metal ABC transporter solute-binding protein, Zn/Mn family [Pseudodesulfovibrio portus]|uniref:Cation ABC transporter substrate-binding protein n=1 Tax=Pseudodesulfovibrio portus TaxID=231439 RepID=A0ABN6RWJ1_9BACT|nr:zinc ABC transporter substrate-binding protein [Pseudodesulfovibrio portus]BDQ34298.1 cation ABC transporter substrate-binding protein [Pseudodesulfovibrio portus]
MRKLILILAVLMFVSPALAEGLNVTVSIAPLKYFVEQIGGGRVHAEIMVPPGASPATYEPRPRQMVQLEKSALFFAVGVPFERAWLPRMQSANPDITVIETQAGIELRPMAAHHHHGDEEEHHGETEERHDNDGPLDPHIWNAPSLCARMAGTILAGLVKADSAGEAEYRANYDKLITRIHEVDARIRTLLTGLSGSSFMVYHPSWGYFARDYGLVQVPVELEGKEPGPGELAEVIDLAKKENIRAIFTQPQFSGKSAATVARAISGKVVTADPLAEDWDENLIGVAARMAEAMR